MAHKSAKELAAIREGQKRRHRIKQMIATWLELIESWKSAGVKYVKGRKGTYSVEKLYVAAMAQLEKITRPKQAPPASLAA